MKLIKYQNSIINADHIVSIEPRSITGDNFYLVLFLSNDSKVEVDSSMGMNLEKLIDRLVSSLRSNKTAIDLDKEIEYVERNYS